MDVPQFEHHRGEQPVLLDGVITEPHAQFLARHVSVLVVHGGMGMHTVGRFAEPALQEVVCLKGPRASLGQRFEMIFQNGHAVIHLRSLHLP